ncbi:MAG: hypothetical protein K2W96_05890, partial [Gemmataceae bacterium]|nr:hypothetical protein [Gemmataceae bacterium]
MAKPLIVAETPNAGALGFRYLASQEGVGTGQASAFVSRCRGPAAETVGENFIGVRKMVARRATGKDAPAVLVLAGIDAKALDPERRAALVKKLHGYLSEVEYAAQQVDWATEKRRVVPSGELAALIDSELAALPAADSSRPAGSGGGGALWLILGAVVLVAAIVVAWLAFGQKKQDKGKPGEDKTKDAGKEQP